MSLKQNDEYNERTEMLEQDLKDAQEALHNAEKETRDAYEWEHKMGEQVIQAQNLLEKHKNNNL